MASRPHHPTDPVTRVETLDPRILYSADAGVVAYVPEPAEQSVQVHEVTAPALAKTQHETGSLVVIDGTLPDVQDIVNDITTRQENGEAIDLLVLNPDESGLDAISNHLQQSGGTFDSIHIVTHGTDSGFELGADLVDAGFVRTHAGELAQWESSLTDQADLLLYGCNLSDSALGELLLQDLAALTTADIAASSNVTGHAALNGDWVLERQLGPIESSLPVSPTVLANWYVDLSATPTGSETLVNTTTGGNQKFENDRGGRQVATNGSQNIVVWEDGNEIYWQLLNLDGSKIGSEQMIQDDNGEHRETPTVAMASNGDFLIVWTSKQDQDGHKEGIYAQLFSADGTPQARPADAYGDGSEYTNPYEFRINSTTDEEQLNPSVAVRSDDSFIVSWTTRTKISGLGIDTLGVSYSVLNADGTRLVEQREAAVGAFTDESASSVAANPATGEAVIAMTRDTNDGDILVRRINADGSHNGSITTLSSPGMVLTSPSVATNSSGEIVVVAAADTDAILLWRLNSDGSLMGGDNPIQVNQSTDVQKNPDVALQDNGNILVTWQEDVTTEGIRARQFIIDGFAVGAQVTPNETLAGDQSNPAIVMHGNSATIAWNGRGAGDNDGIFVRSIDLASPGATVVVSPSLQTSEDGTSVDVTVTLDSQPVGDVDVTIGVSDATEGAVTGGTMTFTPSNWATPQSATVTGLDDAVVDGDETYEVTVNFSSVADPLYASMALTSPIILTNVDNDTATLISNVSDADPAANLVTENSGVGVTVGLTALATDPVVLNTVTYEIINHPENLFVIDPATGVVSVSATANLDYEVADSHSITIRATSRNGLGVFQSSSEATFVIDVADVNDNRPVIGAGQVFSISESASAGASVGTVSATDADSVGALQDWTITGGSGVGVFDLDIATGDISVAAGASLDFETTPTYTLVVRVSDGVGPSADQTITINVSDSSEAPVGSDAAISATEDQAYTFTPGDFSFSDPDPGDSLGGIRIESLPVAGALALDGVELTAGALPADISFSALNNGRLIYNPPENAFGNSVASFDLRVYDQIGQFSTVNTQTIHITGVDDAPVFQPDGVAEPVVVSQPENQAFVGRFDALDVDGDTITYSVTGTDAALFSIDSATGDLSFSGAPDFETPADANGDNQYEVTVVADDSVGPAVTRDLQINVTNTVEALTLTATATGSATEDTEALFQAPALAQVVDGENANNIEFSVSVSDGLLSLDGTNGLAFVNGDGSDDASMVFTGSAQDFNAAMSAVRFTPDTNFNGATTVTVVASDPDTLRGDTASITINVAPVNDLPVVTAPATLNLVAGSGQALPASALSATDIEDVDATLTYTVSVSPASGHFTLNGTALAAGDQFTQADLDAGLLTFQSTGIGAPGDSAELTVTDGNGGSTSVSITVNVATPSPGASDNERSSPVSSGPAESTAGSESAESSESTDESSSDSNTAGGALVAFNPPAADGSDGKQDGQSADQASAVDAAPARTGEAGAGTNDDQQYGGRSFMSQQSGEYTRITPGDLIIKEFISNARSLDQQLTQLVRFDNYSAADLQRALSDLREDLSDQLVLDQQFVASTAAVSTGLSIGYALWLLRSGALLSSILAAMPAWRSIDPLPVLGSLDGNNKGSGDDDSLEAMLEESDAPQPAAGSPVEAVDAPGPAQHEVSQ